MGGEKPDITDYKHNISMFRMRYGHVGNRK